MDILENKLNEIHDALLFAPKKALKSELPEQLMALKHVHPDHIILELGGSIGRNSCCINSILNNKKNHVVIEPNLRELYFLKMNRDNNNFKFQIESSVISDIPMYSKGWRTYKTHKQGSVKVSNLTYEQFYTKYDLIFDVLVIDNEGNFVDNLKTSPCMLDNICMIIIEHDFNSNNDLQYFYTTMSEKNFQMIDSYNKTDKYGPGMNWPDGVKTDPLFVSVWKRKLTE